MKWLFTVMLETSLRKGTDKRLNLKCSFIANNNSNNRKKNTSYFIHITYWIFIQGDSKPRISSAQCGTDEKFTDQ